MSLTEQEVDQAYQNYCEQLKLKDTIWSGYKFGAFIGVGPIFLMRALLSPNDEHLIKTVLPSFNEKAESRIRALNSPNKETLLKAIQARRFGWWETIVTGFYVSLMVAILTGCLIPALAIIAFTELKKKIWK